MTERSNKRMSAVIAAVQRYLDLEAGRSSARAEHSPLSRWKSAGWRTIREASHHPANLWKHAPWH